MRARRTSAINRLAWWGAFLPWLGSVHGGPVPVVTKVTELADKITAIEAGAAGDGFGVWLADVGDTNGDGSLNIADPIALLAYLFASAAKPPSPNSCGLDWQADDLDCRDAICQ
jgi:hypothetical protein